MVMGRYPYLKRQLFLTFLPLQRLLFREKLYLSPVLDLYNSEIITYTIDSRPTYSLVSEMLETALERLSENHQLLMHLDQG